MWWRRPSATATCSRRWRPAATRLGGEQSGHVVFPDLATTGDGILTGLVLADVVQRSGRTLADLAAEAMTRLPQVLVNVRCATPLAGSWTPWPARSPPPRPGWGTAAGCWCARAAPSRSCGSWWRPPPRRGRRRGPRCWPPPWPQPCRRRSLAGHVRDRRHPQPARGATGPQRAASGGLDGDPGRRSDEGLRWPSTNASGSLAVALDAGRATPIVADGLLRGVPGVLALADRPAWSLAVEARFDQLDALRGHQGGPGRGGPGDAGPLKTADIEETNAALVRAKDVLWALRHDRLRTAAAASALAGRDGRGRRALAGFYAGAAGAVGHRPAGGPGSGLGRAPPVRVGPRSRPRRPELAARLAARAEDPLYPSGAVAGGRWRAVVRLQGRGRDRRARRQHGRAAGGDP